MIGIPDDGSILDGRGAHWLRKKQQDGDSADNPPDDSNGDGGSDPEFPAMNIQLCGEAEMHNEPRSAKHAKSRPSPAAFH